MAGDEEFRLENGMVVKVQLGEVAAGMGEQVAELNRQVRAQGETIEGLKREMEELRRESRGHGLWARELRDEVVLQVEGLKEHVEVVRRERWDEVTALKREMGRLAAAVAGQQRGDGLEQLGQADQGGQGVVEQRQMQEAGRKRQRGEEGAVSAPGATVRREYGAIAVREELAALRRELEAAKGGWSEVKAEVTDLKEQWNQAEEERVAAEEEEVKLLRESLAAIEGQVLKTVVGRVEEEVKQLRESLAGIEGQVLTTVVGRVEEETKQLRGSLAAIEGQVLSKVVTRVEEETKQLRGSLEAIEGQVLATVADRMEEETKQLRGSLEAIEQQVLSKVADRVEEETKQLRGSLESIEQQVLEKVVDRMEEEMKQLRGSLVGSERHVLKKVADRVEEDGRRTWEAILSVWRRQASMAAGLELKSLSCLSDTALYHVSSMTHLLSLYLDKSSGFTAAGIRHLYRLPWLENLVLRDTAVTDCALEGIGAVRTLKWLGVSRSHVTDAGLRHLTCLTSLKVLELAGCQRITSAGMVLVGRLTGLERLYIGDTGVRDEGLRHLTGLTRLRMLTLPYGVSDAGMEHLRHLTSLEGLELWNSRVTRVGVQCLRRLHSLRRIRTNVGGVEVLVRRILPGVAVGRDSLFT